MKAASVVVVAAVISVSLVGCGAKAGTPSDTRIPKQSDLLTYVPADTPYVVHLVPEQLAMMGPGLTREFVEGVAGRVLGREELPTAEPGARLRSELARELMPLDAKALARVGWDPERSEAVLYGHGLVPVLRASLDGAKARAALERAAARAKITIDAREQDGVPYVILPPYGEQKLSVVIAFHATQVTAAITLEPEQIIIQLVSLEPAATSLATSYGKKPRDPGAPTSAWLFAAVEPARIAERLRAGDLALLTRKPDFTPACTASLADFVAELPPITNEVWREGDVVSMSYTLAMTPVVANVVADNPGIRWVADPEPDVQLATSLRAGKVLGFFEAMWSKQQQVRAACGDEVETDFGLPAALAPLDHVTGLVIAGDVKGDAIHLGARLDVDEVAPLWTWIGEQFGTGSLPEMPENEINSLGKVNGLELALGHRPTTILGSHGAHDRVIQLSKGEGMVTLPRTLLRCHVGRDVMRKIRSGEISFFGIKPRPVHGDVYDSGMDIDVSLYGELLVARTTGTAVLATK